MHTLHMVTKFGLHRPSGTWTEDKIDIVLTLSDASAKQINPFKRLEAPEEASWDCWNSPSDTHFNLNPWVIREGNWRSHQDREAEEWVPSTDPQLKIYSRNNERKSVSLLAIYIFHPSAEWLYQSISLSCTICVHVSVWNLFHYHRSLRVKIRRSIFEGKPHPSSFVTPTATGPPSLSRFYSLFPVAFTVSSEQPFAITHRLWPPETTWQQHLTRRKCVISVFVAVFFFFSKWKQVMRAKGLGVAEVWSRHGAG